MKALSKPLSSPSRAEKFPPPLMRFLRSNVGSRSRGRSRSSPIFYLRTKKTAVPAGVIQEPSSPKVTCIGQVRVRRSAKTKARKTAVKRRRCCWLKRTLFYGKIPWRFRWRKRPFKGVFCRWGLCLRWCCCKKVDGAEDSFRGYCNEKNEKSGGGGGGGGDNDHSESGCSDNKYENVGGAAQESKRDCHVEVESSSSPSSPPKNALLLTRCRSAPYRSSSLGGRFWGSPLAEPQNESEQEVVQENPNPNPSCCQNVVDLDEDARIISLQESSQELEMLKKKKKKKNSGEEDLKGVNVAGGLTAVHPLLLTRCKSEPARTGERLIINPQPPNQTRFDTSSQHNS
ncbi:UNVERIFIED_CONTAM: hypothetical protein Sradi_5917300 [Sesamum radiatum]|uniref:Uncharacterized protein n=1 Tax=Sesamum radiatum TaxID=300843 RepID=A0AAW2KS11_SESRA